MIRATVVSAMRNLSILFTLALVLGGMRAACGQDTPPAYTDKDAYDIYSMLLAPHVLDADPKFKLVIRRETPPSEGACIASPRGEEAIYDPVIEDFNKVNKREWLLQPTFVQSIRYELVPWVSIKAIFEKNDRDGWKDFYKHYPHSNGYTDLSAVGFNADKTIAIVQYGYACGGLCAGSSYHFFKKTNGTWAEFKWKGTACSFAS